MLYMLLKKYAVGPAMNGIFRPETEGLENIPESGPAILASNHLSFSDSVFLPVAVDRQVYFLAKSEYFTGKGLYGRAVAAFFKGINQIPMDRSGGQRSAQSLSRAAEVLQEGNLLGIYPEGTRSPDGRLYRPKLGVARLALEAGVPVIPVAMVNTDKVQPTGSKLPRLRGEDGPPLDRVRTVIGRPIDLSEFEGQAASHRAQRAVADRIIRAIQELSGQEYVDVYATSVKAVMEKNRAADAKAAVLQLMEEARSRTKASADTARASMDSAREKMAPGMEKLQDRFEDARSRMEDRVRQARGKEEGEDSGLEENGSPAE